MNAVAIRSAKASVVVLAAGTVALALYLQYGSRTQRSEHRAAAADAGSTPAQAPSEPQRHEVRVLEAAARKNPGHTPVLFKLATLAEASGRHNEARRYLEQILSKEPQNLDARLELGKVMFETGDISGAMRNTRLVLESRPDHPDALYNLGAIYANIGNEALAREQWNHLAEVNPSSESGKRATQSLAQLPQDSSQRRK